MRNNNVDIASLILQVSSLILQVYSLVLLMQDYNNSDLMRELQRQDSEYLEKIIQQNEKIIELLERREK